MIKFSDQAHIQSCTCALLSGSLSLFLLIPSELLKTRAQLLSDSFMNYSLEIKSIHNSVGFLGLFQGFWITFLREVPGWGLYFGSYEFLKQQNYHQMVCGGVAGFNSWILAVPFDVVKTRVQAGGKKGIGEVCKGIYEERGVKGFFRGAVPCLVRGTAINAVVLPVFDFLN
jgi:solute carrier family 25 carnitine/acylcarnitine transporter 20/29